MTTQPIINKTLIYFYLLENEAVWVSFLPRWADNPRQIFEHIVYVAGSLLIKHIH